MFHWDKTKVENPALPHEQKNDDIDGNPWWVDISFRDKTKENTDDLGVTEWKSEGTSKWVEVPYGDKVENKQKTEKDNPWVNIPINNTRNSDGTKKPDFLDDANKSNNESPEKNEQKGLSHEEKEKIKKETGWSDEIIDHIENMEQYEIYKNADLHEAEINGKKCLVKNIDMDYVDPKTGLTNRELMQKGRSPIDSKTGEKIELHHMGQDKDGPFAELCENSEHGDGNHSILHPKTDGSWRNEDGANANYDKIERPNHWKARAQEE